MYFNYISGYRVLALVVNVVRDIKLMLGKKRLKKIYHNFSFSNLYMTHLVPCFYIKVLSLPIGLINLVA